MNYLDRLTTVAEQKAAKELPNKFALVFDGWTGGNVHYIALLATFPAQNFLGYRKIILAFSPFEDETSQDSDKGLEFIKFVLERTLLML